jgi:hypothetical protein
MSSFKKISLFLIGFLFLGILISPALSEARGLELNYPKIPGTEVIPNEETSLGQYLAYIYYFAIDILGVVAFVVIVIGGVQYLTSAGSLPKAKAARLRLIGGTVGFLIVLGAFTILRTVNPQLVGIETTKPIPLHGICLYANRGTEEEEMYCFQENTAKVLPEGFKPTELEFEGPRSEFAAVFIFPKEDYEVGEGAFRSFVNPLLFRPDPGKPRPIQELSWSASVGSIYFDKHEFGLYLFPHEGGQYKTETFEDFPKNLPKVLIGTESDLETFNDRTKSLFLRYTWDTWSHQALVDLGSNVSIGSIDPVLLFPEIDFGNDVFSDWGDLSIGGIDPDPGFGDLTLGDDFNPGGWLIDNPFEPDHAWGAIVHTETNGEGECGLIYPAHSKFNRTLPTLNDIDIHPINRIRSVDIFDHYGKVANGSVTFCEQPNQEGNCYTMSGEEIGGGIWHNTINYPWGDIKEKIYSFKIEGSFWVVMSDKENFTGRCQTFRTSNTDLKSEYVLSSTESLLSTKIRSIAIIPIVPAEAI